MKYKLLLMTLLFSFSFLSAGEKPLSPMDVDGATTVDTAKAKALFDDGVIFIDVRSDKDWNAGRIPDAVHIELKKKFTKDSLAAELTMDDMVVFYCNGEKCLRSSKATLKAVEWGYKKAYYYRDGFPAWKTAGYPSE